MIHDSNESLLNLEFKNGLISFFEKNKIVEVVRVTNDLHFPLYCGQVSQNTSATFFSLL